MIYVAVVTDLIFSTKITGTGRALGKTVFVARTLEKLRDHLGGPEVTVIADLNATGVDVPAAIRLARETGAHVVAYVSHVQAELAAAAREAGAQQVMARSAFVEQLPALLNA